MYYNENVSPGVHIVILLVLLFCTLFAVHKLGSWQRSKPCSEFKNTIVQYLPVRCLQELGIKIEQQ